MCPQRTVLKPQLTILLNNLRTHNQRNYVVDVVRQHKISRNSEAFESSMRDLTGLRCRLEFVHFLHIQPACKIAKICEEFSPAMGRASADADVVHGGRDGEWRE